MKRYKCDPMIYMIYVYDIYDILIYRMSGNEGNTKK